ncbi:GntR family transcriptional regulator [Shimwellia pseudoproteus]|uniref:GntR family transcriptional regulator n=1 Tax=Shimwellia pseudoproteus TaxID=570012 RepID=UPI0018EC7D25|nr:GntR family transcriptional regulator [Shimwellia pseudoproteus]MBJ3814629.1 GntR family transcriptional regulator [Shimwellia pseudoproteus]
MTTQAPPQTLIDRTAENIRARIIAGDLTPGTRLSEAALSEQLSISRNTLREVFRLLTQEGLLHHEPNRGVKVALPDMASIIDIYRIRRLLECEALRQAYAMHPAMARMAAAVEAARQWRERGDWRRVGTENMAFHSALVELADSERMNRLYRHISAELRLAFGHLNDNQMLHAPYIEKNAHILSLLQAGNNSEAASTMACYLQLSERTVIAALARHQQQASPAAR